MKLHKQTLHVFLSTAEQFLLNEISFFQEKIHRIMEKKVIAHFKTSWLSFFQNLISQTAQNTLMKILRVSEQLVEIHDYSRVKKARENKIDHEIKRNYIKHHEGQAQKNEPCT
jgi:hypothetical protein